MKKLAILTLAAILTAALPAGAASAASFATADDVDALSADITVNLAYGDLILAGEPITVTDTDSDGVLTVNDALICLHDAKYVGGAEAGFSAPGGFIEKLWGIENYGGYGYYINHASAWSLSDPIKDGDLLYAFIYTDLDFWSDCYTFFDADTISAKEGDSVTLTLTKSSMWYPDGYTLPVEDAVITINGEETEYTTDEEGKVTLTLDEAGTYLISAISEDEVLVPPVCIATVEAVASAPSTTPTPGSTPESTPDSAPDSTPEPEPTPDPEPTPEPETDPVPTGDLTVTAALLGLLTVAGTVWACRRRSRDDA